MSHDSEDPTPDELDDFDAIAASVNARLTPEELAIRRDHIMMCIEVENLCRAAANDYYDD